MLVEVVVVAAGVVVCLFATVLTSSSIPLNLTGVVIVVVVVMVVAIVVATVIVVVVVVVVVAVVAVAIVVVIFVVVVEVGVEAGVGAGVVASVLMNVQTESRCPSSSSSSSGSRRHLSTHAPLTHLHSPLHHDAPLPCGQAAQSSALWFPHDFMAAGSGDGEDPFSTLGEDPFSTLGADPFSKQAFLSHLHSPLHHDAPWPCGQAAQLSASWFPQDTTVTPSPPVGKDPALANEWKVVKSAGQDCAAFTVKTSEGLAFCLMLPPIPKPHWSPSAVTFALM